MALRRVVRALLIVTHGRIMLLNFALRCAVRALLVMALRRVVRALLIVAQGRVMLLNFALRRAV